MHEAGVRSGLVGHKLDEANHRSVQKCARVNAAVRKRAGIFSRALECHAVMRKRPALSNGRFIVNLANSLSEIFVTGNFAKYDALLFGLAGAIPRIGANLVV